MNKSIKRAYKYRFYPQKELIEILAKTFGCVRFVYNQTLYYSEEHFLNKFIYTNNNLNSQDDSNQASEIDKNTSNEINKEEEDKNKILNPNYKSLSSTDRINYIKTLKGNKDYNWLNEVSSIALQQSVRHLNEAYNRFFKRQAAKPQYKKKLNRNSFTITGKNSLHFDKDFIHNKQFFLPKYNKPLKIKWGKGKAFRTFNHLAVSSVTISQEPSGQYYISFLVNEEIKSKLVTNSDNNPEQRISYDLGLKTTAKVYQGKINESGDKIFNDFKLPELIETINKKIQKQQRILSRKEKRSKNRNKQRIKVARLHEKKSNILKDYYHKLSTQIINENQVIMREDLGVKNMLKNRKLSKAIHNVAWSRFNTMIDYKAQWHNREIITVNRFYPSSKTCSGCGYIYKALTLSERQWTCVSCNAQHDRDENACLNLYQYYDKNHNNVSKISKNKVNTNNSKKNSKAAVGTTVVACGGDVRPVVSKKVTSKKQLAISSEAGIPCIKAGVVQPIS